MKQWQDINKKTAGATNLNRQKNGEKDREKKSNKRESDSSDEE